MRGSIIDNLWVMPFGDYYIFICMKAMAKQFRRERHTDEFQKRRPVRVAQLN
jgi:hypothetical protein